MDVQEGQAPARQGRCANHPAVAQVGLCDVCGRPLCVACATPVRGRLVGPECLSQVLEIAPPATVVPAPLSRHGDLVAAAGFLMVLALSVIPWSHGLVSGPFTAWTPHWSLIACGCAVLGEAVSLRAAWSTWRPAIEASAQGLLAAAVVTTSILHAGFPPSLSQATAAPFFAAVAGGIALAGVAIKAVGIRRAGVGPRRP
jgi:hypothetical protein